MIVSISTKESFTQVLVKSLGFNAFAPFPHAVGLELDEVDC